MGLATRQDGAGARPVPPLELPDPRWEMLRLAMARARLSALAADVGRRRADALREDAAASRERARELRRQLDARRRRAVPGPGPGRR